jgi:hypothetical protein
MTKLKFEGAFAKGDMVRAYDFHGNVNCYYEGRVVNEKTNHRGAQCYLIYVTKRVWDGTDCPNERGLGAFVPHQLSIRDWDERVTKLRDVPIPKAKAAAKKGGK